MVTYNLIYIIDYQLDNLKWFLKLLPQITLFPKNLLFLLFTGNND